MSMLARTLRVRAPAAVSTRFAAASVRSLVATRQMSTTFEEKEKGAEAAFFSKNDREKLQQLLDKLEAHTEATKGAAAAAAASAETAAAAKPLPPTSEAALKSIFNKYRISLTTKMQADLTAWKASN